MRLFQKSVTAVLFVFLGVLVLATVIAYSRPSGSTRQDMAKAQHIRRQALAENNE